MDTHTQGRYQEVAKAKNGAIVRQVVGYDRLVGEHAYRQLIELYRALRLYVNCFQPSMKLLAKQREAKKVRRVYDAAKTPLQRLLLSNILPAQKQHELLEVAKALDPIHLFQQLEQLQQAIVTRLPQYDQTRSSTEHPTHSSTAPNEQKQRGFSPLALPLQKEPPTQLVRLAQQSLHDIATHAVDFTDVTKLLWTETDNFSGLEPTVKEQVGHPLLTSVGKKLFEDLPHLTAVSLVFHFWLSWPSWLRQ